MIMTPTVHHNGILLCLLGHKWYPLLSWVLTSHKNDSWRRIVLEALFNKKHKCGILVVKNAFGLLKQFWHELIYKIKLDMKFVLDVVMCSCILHNLCLDAKKVEVNEFMHFLALKVAWDLDYEKLENARPQLKAKAKTRDVYKTCLQNSKVGG